MNHAKHVHGDMNDLISVGSVAVILDLTGNLSMRQAKALLSEAHSEAVVHELDLRVKTTGFTNQRDALMASYGLSRTVRNMYVRGVELVDGL